MALFVVKKLKEYRIGNARNSRANIIRKTKY